VNRSELERQVEDIETKLKNMQLDLDTFGAPLSASSQLAIILRMVDLSKEIEEYKKMLDILTFEDITKNF
jgi:archaellum component FlaC